MRSHRRNPLSLLSLAVVIACGQDPETPTPRADLVGVWDLVTVNGASLPTASPEEDNVDLERLVMTLEADGGYTLASRFRVNDAPATETTIGGSWVATSDVLTFRGSEGPSVVVFGYAMEDGLLSMIDEQGHEWVLRRR